MDSDRLELSPEFWETIDRYQQANGLDWAQLAQAVNILPDNAAAIKEGRSVPSAQQLLRLANMMGLHISHLLSSDMDPFEAVASRENTDVRRTLDLVRAFTRIHNPAVQEWVITLLHEIANEQAPSSVSWLHGASNDSAAG